MPKPQTSPTYDLERFWKLQDLKNPMSTSLALRIDTEEVCALFIDMSFRICLFGHLCCEFLHSYDQWILLDTFWFGFSPGF